ncbi:hypothetical protein ABPG75_003153 [Micractinium tetrahymenae]
MYLAHSSLESALSVSSTPPFGGMLISVDRRLFALSDASGSKRAPQVVSAELPDGNEAPLSLGGVAQRLLAGPHPPPVLDGAAFVAAASALPPSQLRACLENCLLECTNTRAARADENSGFASSKLNLGLAALVQHATTAAGGAAGGAGAGAGPSGAGGNGEPALFPASAGLPSLGELLRAAVLPPSATARLVSPPAAQLFAAHSPVGAGRRSAAEHFDVGSVPSLYPRGRSHVRSAARRGGRYYCLLSGMPVWHHFDLSPAEEADSQQLGQQQGQQAEEGAARGKGKQPRRQQQQKRKHGATAGAGTGPAALPPANQRRQHLPAAMVPRTLRQSACSCSSPDLGVLWCAHRCDGMAGLLSDPGLHVLDCDALEALLVLLSPLQLAQLLLTVAFTAGTLPDVVLSLQLASAAQAALFLPRLGSLPLPVPLTSELRLCCYSPADAALASYQSTVGTDPYSYAHPARDGATTSANPLQPAHMAMRLSVLSPVGGSVLQGVDSRVQPLSPELVWHLKGMGLDALDLFPEALSHPNAAGIWPAEVRSGVALGFEDALGLARALSMLGGSYAPVALQLLKDLTITAAHPLYCSVALPTNTRSSFARRLAQLWQQMTTPEQRWQLFLEGGMRLPAVWSEVVVEVAWQVVGQFPVLWSLARHLQAAMRGTSRAAAMALLTRGSALLPRSAAGAGASAFTDLLLFERSMQRGFTQHADGLTSFLKQKQGQLRPAREGSLLQHAARSVAQQLLSDQPLAQSHAAFQELILDLQEAVLAEAARLLQDTAFSDVPAPGALQAEAPLPAPLRTAGTVLKSHTVGGLNTGQAYNAEGLDRHALPPHLPPALVSTPFNWVTLDVRAMLALPPPRSAAACWAAAYLQLAPKYSPAGSVPLWAWLRQGGMLGLLLGCAISATARRDWHVAAMLADSAVKYLNSSNSLAPPAAAAEQEQLQAARPLLRTLASAAALQLRACLALLGALGGTAEGGDAPGGGAMLTHTSSLRACCLLLRAVLTLMAEALEPLLLQPGGGAAPAGMPPHLLQMMGMELPAGMEQLLNAHQAAMQAHAMLQQAAQHVADAVQAAQQVQLAAGVLGQADAAAVQLQAGQQQQQQQQHPQGGQQQQQQGAQQGQAAAAQPPGPPTPAAAAAAVAAGQPLQQPLPQAAVEALAADAGVLLQVAEVAMRLVHTTLCAPPLLPLANNVPSAATSSARLRPQQDTALWRAAELTAEYEQYPYHHDIGEDGPQSRAFAPNEVMVLLSQALPVALLPLLGRPGGQQGAAPAAAGAGPSQPPQQPAARVTRGQAGRQSGGGAAASSRARQQGQQQGLQPDVAALETALISLLPLADRLGTRLIEMVEEASGRPGGTTSTATRMKHSASVSLLCCVLHLASGTGEGVGAAKMAALPSVWKLLSSYSLDVVAVASDRPSNGHGLRLTYLAPPTLLHMLRACTVVPASSAGGAGAAAAAGAAADTQQQAGEEEEEQPPAAKRRRRSGRLGKAAEECEPPAGSAATAAAAAGGDEGAPAPSQAPPFAAAAAAGEQGPGTLQVGPKQLDVSLVQTAVSRVLMWLTAGVQENWRASNYALWRPRRIVPAPAAPNAAGAGAFAAAAAAAAAAGVGPGEPQGGAAVLAAGPLQQEQQGGAGEDPPPQGGAQQAAAAGPAAEPAAPAAAQVLPPALPRPRQAFIPRQAPNSLVAGAFSGHWPVAAIEVLHWWLQHRAMLQPPEVCTGGAAAAAAAATAMPSALSGAREARRDYVFQLMGMEGAGGGRLDSRQDFFPTLDGPVRLASTERSSPKLRTLAGTLLTLLCMECASDVHAAAASALVCAARQPGNAAELADCAPFWVLHRLLARRDGEAALPAQLAGKGREVVQAAEAALLAQSGEWAAVLGCQAAVAADAEALTAERRAAATAAAHAAAAGAPQLDAAGNPLLPPPAWFGGHPPFDAFDPFNMAAHMGMPIGVPGVPMMAPDFDDEFDEEEGDEFAEDEMFDEDVGDVEDDESDLEGDMDGDPWFF